MERLDKSRQNLVERIRRLEVENEELRSQHFGDGGEGRDAEQQEEISRLVAILEATPDFVGLADAKGVVRFINRAGRRMVGLAEDEDLAGRRIPNFHPDWANKLLFDEERLPYYDIKNTQYLLSFGADFLTSWLSPVHHGLGYGHMRQGRPGRRGKFVQVEPRLSLTGANADEWVAAKPGTEGLLALGIAHLMVRNGHYEGDD